GWIDAEGRLPTLALLRQDILRGDYRVLYLAWLKIMSIEREADDVGDPLEWPVPANLQNLSPPLKKFVELFEIDEDLLAAASEFTPKKEDIQERNIEELIGKLSDREQKDFLVRLARGEPSLNARLMRRLDELAFDKSKAAKGATSVRLSVAELFAVAREKTRQR